MSFASDVVEVGSFELSGGSFDENELDGQSSHDYTLNRYFDRLSAGACSAPALGTWLTTEERSARIRVGVVKTGARILSYGVVDEEIQQRPEMSSVVQAMPMPMPFDDDVVGLRWGWRQKSATFPI